MAVESARKMTKAEYNALLMEDAMKMLEQAMKKIDSASGKAREANENADAALDKMAKVAELLKGVTE